MYVWFVASIELLYLVALIKWPREERQSLYKSRQTTLCTEDLLCSLLASALSCDAALWCRSFCALAILFIGHKRAFVIGKTGSTSRAKERWRGRIKETKFPLSVKACKGNISSCSCIFKPFLPSILPCGPAASGVPICSCRRVAEHETHCNLSSVAQLVMA